MKAKLISFSLLVTLVLPAHAVAEFDFLGFYQRYMVALSQCPDVECYKSIYRKMGTKSALEGLEKLGPEKLNTVFQGSQRFAGAMLADPTLYVESQEIAEGKALVKVRSRKKPKAKYNLSFQKIDGVWKLGN